MSDSSKNEQLEPKGISSSSISNEFGPRESVEKPKIGESYFTKSHKKVESHSPLPKSKPAENELKRKMCENVEMSQVSFLSYFFQAVKRKISALPC